MLYLDSENKKDMNLYINCSGGEVRWDGVLWLRLVERAAAVQRAACAPLPRPLARPNQSCPPQLHTAPSVLLPTPATVAIDTCVQVVPSLAIHDTMRHIKSDVGTVGFGGCMGMSGFLLAVGKKVRWWVQAGWQAGGGGQQGIRWRLVGGVCAVVDEPRLEPSPCLPHEPCWLCRCGGQRGTRCRTPAHLSAPAATRRFSERLCTSSVVLQGKRYALQNTRIMVHHPSGAARGQARAGLW